MKKFCLLITIIIACFITSFSHEINNYRIICLDIQENPYGIEKRFKEEFMKFGFQIIDHEFYETFDAKNKSITLFLDYDYFLNYNGPSTLSVVLTNAAGITVWKASGQGNTFLSPSGDMKGATKQIMKQFTRLKYKFEEPVADNDTIENPFSNWNEDSVKVYLNSHMISPIEGIYKNYSNDGNSYKIAILKEKDRYVGIIVDADNTLWKKGEIKITLSYIDGIAYDAEYFDANRKKLNALAGLKDNRILEFSVPNKGDLMNFSFLKIYPSGNERNNLVPNNNIQYKATGSGVLVYDNIIITNYHVIKDSEKVEAVVNINGIPETFSARVLCSDKTNDLA
ncbi:MAG: trypsin-like peptidase domain-containing protein, partial [Muribaculaceae bacterium]|nr:trypsin-like peptidase domain-containing protein [Muribaculaceae bacterium]